MTIALRTFSSGKIVNENITETPLPINYKLESLLNPVPYIEDWGYKRTKNQLKTRKGYVFIKGMYDEVLRKRKFYNRTDRNNIVNSFCKEVAHTDCYVSIEFD